MPGGYSQNIRSYEEDTWGREEVETGKEEEMEEEETDYYLRCIVYLLSDH